jgi:hypothetical protein
MKAKNSTLKPDSRGDQIMTVELARDQLDQIRELVASALWSEMDTVRLMEIWENGKDEAFISSAREGIEAKSDPGMRSYLTSVLAVYEKLRLGRSGCIEAT